MNSEVDMIEPPAADGLRWAAERLKVVEDQRAADLELIETLSRRVAKQDEYLDSANRMIDEKVATIAIYEKAIHAQNEMMAAMSRDNIRLRHDLARAGTDLDRLTKGAVTPDPSRDGAQRLHNWFGLSYANYLTLPRSILQSMPGEWQGKLTDLLAELGEAFAAVPDHGTEYHVQLRDEDGGDVEDPLAEYRRPDRDYIEFLRKK